MPKRKLPTSASSPSSQSPSILSFFKSTSIASENTVQSPSSKLTHRRRASNGNGTKTLGTTAENAVVIDDSSGDEGSSAIRGPPNAAKKSRRSAGSASTTSATTQYPAWSSNVSSNPVQAKSYSNAAILAFGGRSTQLNDAVGPDDVNTKVVLDLDADDVFTNGRLDEEEQDVLKTVNGVSADALSCPVCSVIFDESDGVSGTLLSTRSQQ